MKKFILFIPLLISGCMTADQHLGEVRHDTGEEKNLTVGVVQKEIRKGMSGAEVAEVLGSPNIVSTDEVGREVWVYDKISTENVQSSSASGIAVLIVGGSQSAGASSTSQRTFTVIVKFDENGKIRDFAYHTSRF
ncbi:MAG: outer membrane protein assembly factor BamE [Betaproteobacteria bacterium]|nr:outer membrane protein assembly factor BamE [Betaproteobacteria bacterium]